MFLGPALALPAVRRASGVVLFAPSVADTFTLASLGIAATGAGTYIARATITTVGTGTEQIIVQVDGGVNTDRIYLRNPGVGVTATLVRFTGGVGATASPGSLASGVEFRIGMSLDGAGNAIASLDGAASVSVSGAPSSGLTTLRIGESANGASDLGGTIAVVRVLPGVVLADAALRAEVLAT